MVSISESMKGLNGDGWCTTISEEDQRKHLEYVKNMNLGGGLNASYEQSREKELAEMRKEMGLKPDFSRDADLTSMKTSFIDGFLPKEKPLFDVDSIVSKVTERFNKYIDEIKYNHTNATKDLQNKLNEMSKRVEMLESEVKELKAQKLGFFGRISKFFKGLF